MKRETICFNVSLARNASQSWLVFPIMVIQSFANGHTPWHILSHKICSKKVDKKGSGSSQGATDGN